MADKLEITDTILPWSGDGKWAAMTLGTFLQMLVDTSEGKDIAMIRTLETGEVDKEKCFRLNLEVHLVPRGQFKQHVEELGCERVHRILAEAIKQGWLNT